MAEKHQAKNDAPRKREREPSAQGGGGQLRAYRPPTIEVLGDMRDVTRKSGVLPDAKQVTKPGSGQG